MFNIFIKNTNFWFFKIKDEIGNYFYLIINGSVDVMMP